MSEALRVAVIGAGRIGKQHAKWYQMVGCQVVAFVGSSPESVARTQEALKEMLGRCIPGYTHIARMAEEAKPSAVSVCTPHALHCEHAIQAMEAGLHVLCEKPLVWDDEKPREAVLADARRMLSTAQRCGVLLGMNAQYVAGIPAYLEWYAAERGPLTHAECFEAVMQSRGRAGSAEYEQIWVDLASHPLSLILKWQPNAQLDSESIQCTIRRKEVVATFRCFSPNGHACDCHIRLGNVPEGALQRSFGVNGFVLHYEGRNDAHGIYRAYLRRGDVEREYPDFLHTSIAEFVRAVRGEAPLLIPAEEACRNLEWQIEILDKGVREGE